MSTLRVVLGSEPYSFDQYHLDVYNQGYPDAGENLVYPALGCAGEAGELAEKVKKLWRDAGTMDGHSPAILRPSNGLNGMSYREGIIKEAGDVLWYLNSVAFELGTTLAEIAKMNAAKLADRRRRAEGIHGEGDCR